MDGYSADLSLCRLAAIAISKHLWMRSDLKDALKSCMDNNKEPKDIMPPIMKKMMDEFVVPGPAKEEVVFAVGAMGWEIWAMFKLLKDKYYSVTSKNLLFASEVSTGMDYVSWRPSGGINPFETMRSLYFAGLLRESYSTWYELSRLCLEDCIIDLWPKININQSREWADQRAILTVRNEIAGDEHEEFFSDYWIARMQNDLRPAIILLKTLSDDFFNETYSPEENLFIYSFTREQYWAVKYFWESLNGNQKRRTIAKICESIMSDNPDTDVFKDLFFSDEALSSHFLVFFFQQLSRYGFNDVKIKLLGSEFVLNAFLDWPLNDLFINTLRESWIHHNVINYGPIISDIFLLMCNCKEYLFVDRDVKYRRIFYTIWKMNPHNLKSSVDYEDILCVLWKSKNVELLKYILSDEDLKDRREEFLNGIVEIYDHDEIDMNYFVEFIVKVLVSEEERVWFGRQIASAVKQHEEDVDVDW